ncbi:hypothetical protein [Dactylosporangium sp. NPDC051484]|uniref:hypothetical protein n=1 Tax=Dactylosporangium sp. NPDC051484 TaxID=3154942 RepID=UPI00344CE9EC
MDQSAAPFIQSIRRGVRQAGDVALLLSAAVDAGVDSMAAVESAIMHVYDDRIDVAAVAAHDPLFSPCPDLEAAKLLGRIVSEQAVAFTLAVQMIADAKDISVAEAVQQLNRITEG